MYHSLFTPSPVEERLAYFQIVAIINKATKNIHYKILYRFYPLLTLSCKAGMQFLLLDSAIAYSLVEAAWHGLCLGRSFIFLLLSLSHLYN